MFVKKDIPACKRAGYRSLNKKSDGERTDQKHRNIVETRKGTKTNRAGLGKGNAIPRNGLHSPP
ncbi:acetyltransferase [Rhizobium sp. BK377]|uniref:acetyltransferase n=1 Tax=Rhizobium sp. BK377 TaxID=2587058 RepID=UPI00160CA5E9|nr:acetyltransferase [Rhizobium sp. BK377]